MKKLSPNYCLMPDCSCGGKRILVPLLPKAARLQQRQRAAATAEMRAAIEARLREQAELARILYLAAPGGNA
jgi:hypothetical protein